MLTKWSRPGSGSMDAAGNIAGASPVVAKPSPLYAGFLTRLQAYVLDVLIVAGTWVLCQKLVLFPCMVRYYYHGDDLRFGEFGGHHT